MGDKVTYTQFIDALKMKCEIEFTYQGENYGFIPTNQQTQWMVYRAYDEASEQVFDTYEQALQEAKINGVTLDEIFKNQLYEY